jgi:DNA gyrase subunit A
METFKDGTLLSVTEKGSSKRTPLDEFRTQVRGGKGMIGMRVLPKSGKLVGVMVVQEDDEVMMITMEGIMIRVSVDEISTMGRATQGVKTMRIMEEDKVVAIARVINREDE